MRASVGLGARRGWSGERLEGRAERAGMKPEDVGTVVVSRLVVVVTIVEVNVVVITLVVVAGCCQYVF